MNELKEHKELFRLASLIVCEPHDEERYRQDLLDYITTYTAKQCLKEVVGFAGTNHNNRKFCEHYEERYKYLKGKLDQLQSQLTNNKEGN